MGDINMLSATSMDLNGDRELIERPLGDGVGAADIVRALPATCTAHVPGDVTDDLVRAGGLPEPLVGVNLALPDVPRDSALTNAKPNGFDLEFRKAGIVDSGEVRLPDRALTARIISAASAVHKALGPGFLESIYEEAPRQAFSPCLPPPPWFCYLLLHESAASGRSQRVRTHAARKAMSYHLWLEFSSYDGSAMMVLHGKATAYRSRTAVLLAGVIGIGLVVAGLHWAPWRELSAPSSPAASAGNVATTCAGRPGRQYDPVVTRWAGIFDPSVLSFDERCAELAWFRETGAAFAGMSLTSVAEDIEGSFWESQFLSRAFAEITGIRVRHEVIGEGDVVDRLVEQIEQGKHLYDIYVSDADLNGWHLRTRGIVVLSDYMAGEGKTYTNPQLDLGDFLNLECAQDYDGRQLQIPDYHFPLVYWFRHDWFSDPAVRADFRKRYGYELGVPLNWAAYEDIAAFFHGRKMTNPNGSEVVAYGHADYGLPGPWLGWRFSDAFLGLAGVGDVGLPNGLPVDDWGIRVENRIPVGASVERGGAVNSPAAVYALTTWLSMLNRYAPPESRHLDWLGLGRIPPRGDIAQTWYWCQIYAALNHEYNKVGSPACDKQGNPLWRVAPMPRGKYWRKGMKMGYMDAGSWTLPLDTDGPHRHAAWLWAQFCLSKTVALKKFMVDATPVRKSTLYSAEATRSQQRLGGLIEFLRSPLIKNYTDTGLNVPHYPRMSALWWQNISRAIEGTASPQEALDDLAEQLDDLMGSLTLDAYSPQLNPRASKAQGPNRAEPPPSAEQERPRTCIYEDLLKDWKSTAP
jgi:glycerol transport system substrate-binding protein